MADVTYNYTRASLVSTSCAADQATDCQELEVLLEWDSTGGASGGRFEIYRYIDGGVGGVQTSKYVTTVPWDSTTSGVGTYTDTFLRTSQGDTERGNLAGRFDCSFCPDSVPGWDTLTAGLFIGTESSTSFSDGDYFIIDSTSITAGGVSYKYVFKNDITVGTPASNEVWIDRDGVGFYSLKSLVEAINDADGIGSGPATSGIKYRYGSAAGPHPDVTAAFDPNGFYPVVEGAGATERQRVSLVELTSTIAGEEGEFIAVEFQWPSGSFVGSAVTLSSDGILKYRIDDTQTAPVLAFLSRLADPTTSDFYTCAQVGDFPDKDFAAITCNEPDTVGYFIRYFEDTLPNVEAVMTNGFPDTLAVINVYVDQFEYRISFTTTVDPENFNDDGFGGINFFAQRRSINVFQDGTLDGTMQNLVAAINNDDSVGTGLGNANYGYGEEVGDDGTAGIRNLTADWKLATNTLTFTSDDQERYFAITIDPGNVGTWAGTVTGKGVGNFDAATSTDAVLISSECYDGAIQDVEYVAGDPLEYGIPCCGPKFTLKDYTCGTPSPNCALYEVDVVVAEPISFAYPGIPSLDTLFVGQIYDDNPSSVCSINTYTIYRQVNGGALEEIATGETDSSGPFYTFTDNFFISSDGSLCTDPAGPTLDLACDEPITGDPSDILQYYVAWEVTARVISDSSCPDSNVEKITSDPLDFRISPQQDITTTGLPCCPVVANLTASIGDCFSEQQGEVAINWGFNLGEGETPVNVEIDRNPSASIPAQSTTLPPEYGQLSGGWIDTGVLLPVSCSGPETVIYDVTLNYTDAAGNVLSTTQSVEVEVPCCADDCGDVEDPCNLCWGVDGADVKIYLESYFENPLATPKEASFQIKYCINNACADGIDSAEVYVTLPVGIEVTGFNSDAAGVSFEESFLGGIYPGRWKFIVPSGSATSLLPSFGVLGTVIMDKPLGDAVACIDEENSSVTVDYTTDGGGIQAYEPDTNFSYSGATGTEDWQTGPCLSTCTDEVDMGFGDFHYSMDAVDNSIFDVKYCLTQGSIDSFVLVCLTGDFKTTVTAIDAEFGDVALRGWNVNFRNLAPGFTVIYGRGSRPIPTSGLSTLMRVYLSDNILQRNPAGEESCMCVFPVFMNLGSLFPLVSNYIVNLNTQTNISLKDSERISGVTEASYTAPEPTTSGAITTSFTRDISAFTSDAVVRETSISANFSPPSSDGYQIGSGFIADLETIGEQLDERFKPLLDCLKVSYGRAITGYQNDEEYARETRENAIRTVHYFRIFFTIWTALLRSIPNLAAKFQNSVQTVDTSCTNAIGVIFDCEEIEGDSYIRCNITYDASLCPISGVGFDIKEFQEFIDDSGNNVTYSDVYSWVGDASDKNYFQAYSTSTGRYLSAYGANLAQRRDSDTQIEYLRTDKSTDVSIVPQYLTTIYLKVENFINWGVSKFNFENSICTTVFDSKDDEVAWNLLDDPLLPNYASFVSLRKAIKIGLNKATVVTNEKGTTPNAAWTGNSFAPSGTQVVDVKDFLTTMVNVIEPDTFDLSEGNLEALVKLPSGTTATTLKEFYDLNDIDLSGVTYSPSGTNPYTDPTGNYILPTIDANADGRVDIVDFVALRNTWLYSGKYPLSDAATISAKQIVPTECCLKIDTDAEILVPDQCSQFCIQPPCYGKVWISDMLLVKDKFDRPNKYILEISYAVNCSDERVGEVDYPVQDVSGVQFRVEGLNGVGIVSSINGFGTEQGVTATACKAKAWSDYILSSDNTTKDTVIAFSTNGKYIDKGKGALCYLFVDPESIPDSASYLANRFEEEFITTNEFIKFDDSPEIQEIANVAGSKVGYPLANLRYNSYHTDELLIYERFGIRVTDYKLSTNRYYKDDIEVPEYINLTSEPAASWTGDRAGDGVDDADLEYVLRLAATSRFNTYESEYDADANGVIDILDVQAVAHTINNEVFEYGTNVVPRYCCSLGELPEPKISILDYDDGDKTIPVIQNGKIREITISGSSLGCGSNPENQGGILLYWDTVKYADYYVVYRKSKKDTFAIPIIAAGPGNRNRVGTFPGVDRTADRKPISILPNMWIDYPPQKENDCSTLANFDVEAYFEGSVADSVTNEIKTRLDITELTPGAVSESFTYWVVAISREGEIKSNEESGLTSLCNFSPISSNISLNTVRDTTVASNFDAYHPLASRPIGAAEQVLDEPLPVWFFTQNSISGKGRESITQKGGVVTTDSKLPDRNDASGVNQRKFTYQPKPNFVGKDNFKYVTTIVDIRNRFKPSTWCKSIGTVTVFVTPPPPTLSARAGENNLPDEKDKAFLLWYQSNGATSYRLYRDSVLIDTIDAEFEKLDSYTYTDSAPTLPSCPGGNPVENIYEISSVYLDEDGTEIESVKNSASAVFVCPPDLDTSAVSITLTAIGFNIPIGGTRLSQGTVNVSWTTVTNAQGYIIYRRESTLPGPWIVIGTTTDTTFSDKISSCNDCSTTQSYDYYISATARGFESDPSPSQNISIPCYDAFVPQVSDKTATIQERGTLSSFVTARAVQGTISTYTLITSPASDEGTLTFNPDGTFTFVAALNFTGTTQFEWQAEDSCGNTSNALFTINVEAVSTNTNLEYVIGDANEVTSQQNATQVRIRNRKTSQVPFMLNNKGASSLRKRCFAFAVTRGIEPFSWAPGTDGCSTPNRFPPLDPTIDPGDLCTDPTIGSAIIGSSKIGGCE